MLRVFQAALVAAMVMGAAAGGVATAAREQMDDPALDRLATLVGGTWVCDNGKGFVVEHRYELAMGGKAIRSTSVIGKGTPAAMPVETMFGWDPTRKRAYYIDFHGHDTVYAGSAQLSGASVVLDFKQIVGPEGSYRARIDFVDRETFHAVIMGLKDGRWADIESFTFKRRA